MDEIEQQEQESSQEHLAESRRVADAYTGYLDYLSGKQTEFSVENFGLTEESTEKIKALTDRAEQHFDGLQKMVESKDMNAADILKDILGERSAQLNDHDFQQARLETSRSGALIIKLPDEVFYKIRKGAQAFAAIRREGISAIIIRDLSPEKYPEYFDENVPHELHHLVWNFARQDGALENSEFNPELSDAFDMYQDELMARLSSGGSLGGYTRHTLRGTEEPVQVSEAVQEMNAWLNQEVSPILRSRGEDRSVLLEAALNATSFTDLRSRIELTIAEVRKLPEKEVVADESSDDWVTV